MYEIDFEPEAFDVLRSIPAYDRARVVDEIERHLTNDPFLLSRRMKVVHGMIPPWSDVAESFRQLKVDPYRVLYDVNEEDRVVTVRDIRIKSGGMSTKEALK